jgi:uncharacterized protein YndB with AHSA1/START domain
MASWWPLRTHSLGQERAQSVVFEARVGGHIYETDAQGQRCVWGTVLAWEPPVLVRFTWHPGQPENEAQQVEVRFAAEAEGTRLELTHSGWEALGKRAALARRGYNIGWIPVLDRWAARASVAGALVNALSAVAGAVMKVRGRRRRAAAGAAAPTVTTAQPQGSSPEGP